MSYVRRELESMWIVSLLPPRTATTTCVNQFKIDDYFESRLFLCIDRYSSSFAIFDLAFCLSMSLARKRHSKRIFFNSFMTITFLFVYTLTQF